MTRKEFNIDKKRIHNQDVAGRCGGAQLLLEGAAEKTGASGSE